MVLPLAWPSFPPFYLGKMPLPSPHVVSTSEIFVSGDVIIHESAVISPGTILRAAPDSRIIISEGVCLGMGVVLSASGGDIEVHLGAILGAGVLIIGASVIGDHACIGATTTVFNASVAPQVMVPTNSLLGDTSRQISPEIVEESEIPVQEVEEVKKSSVVGQVYINQMLLTLFPERRQKIGK